MYCPAAAPATSAAAAPALRPEPVTPPASAQSPLRPISERSRRNGDAPGTKLELLFTAREAMLSIGGKQLMYFQSPVRVGGEEILDWKDKGLITELVSLESLGGTGGIPITARAMDPDSPERNPDRTRSERSLLLNPQWFSIYFITFSTSLWEDELNGSVSEDALKEIYNKLQVFFASGKALADYQHRSIYLLRFRIADTGKSGG